MRKLWHLYDDIFFSQDEPAVDARSQSQTEPDAPDPVEIYRNREMTVGQLFEAPAELDRWIDLYLSDNHERFRYAHLFHEIGASGRNPVLEGHRIYHGKISRVENSDRLRVWLQTHPRDRDVYFQIPHYYDDHLQKCGPSEWQDLLEGLQSPDVTLFVVGNYFQEEWHTLSYLASSPSLIRTRYVTSPSP